MTVGITHKAWPGKNPDKDNLINLRSIKANKKLSLKEVDEELKDPSSTIVHVTEDEIYPCNILKFKV